MGLKENEISGSGPGYTADILEGRRPGPSGAGLPSLELQPHDGSAPGSGEGPADGHGGHRGQVGAISLPPAAGPGAGETGAAAAPAVQGLGAENGPRVQAQGPVHTIGSPAQAGQTCAALQDTTN